MTTQEKIRELIWNTTFGIEIEMHGISRFEAAKVARDVIRDEYGAQCLIHHAVTYDARSFKDHLGREWKFVRDGSIIANSDECKTELNTPPLKYREDFELLAKILRALKCHGAKSDPAHNCGMHVHVSGAGHTVNSLKNFIYLVYANDELIRDSFGITYRKDDDWRATRDEWGNLCRSHWCRPFTRNFISEVKAAKNLSDLREVWYRYLGDGGYQRDHYNSSRYHLLNLHRYFQTIGEGCNTVEIRAFNGVLDVEEIRAAVLFALTLNAASLVQKSVKAQKNPVYLCGNSVFAMRTWLNRCGWTTPEFREAHKTIEKRLAGDPAWRYGRAQNLYMFPTQWVSGL